MYICACGAGSIFLCLLRRHDYRMTPPAPRPAGLLLFWPWKWHFEKAGWLRGGYSDVPTCVGGGSFCCRFVTLYFPFFSLLRAGCHFKFWVADWFAQLNNKMGGDLKKIQVREERGERKRIHTYIHRSSWVAPLFRLDRGTALFFRNDP